MGSTDGMTTVLIDEHGIVCSSTAVPFILVSGQRLWEAMGPKWLFFEDVPITSLCGFPFLFGDGPRYRVAIAQVADGFEVCFEQIPLAWSHAQALEEHRATRLLGRYVAGIASEFGDPLTVMLGRLELVMALGEVDPLVKRHLDVALQHGQQLGVLLNNLRQSSLVKPAVGVAVDSLIRQAVELLGARASQVTVPRIASIWTAAGPEPQLVRMLFNLLCQLLNSSSAERALVMVRQTRSHGEIILKREGNPSEFVLRELELWLARFGGAELSSRSGSVTISLPLQPPPETLRSDKTYKIAVHGSRRLASVVQILLQRDGVLVSYVEKNTPLPAGSYDGAFIWGPQGPPTGYFLKNVLEANGVRCWVVGIKGDDCDISWPLDRNTLRRTLALQG